MACGIDPAPHALWIGKPRVGDADEIVLRPLDEYRHVLAVRGVAVLPHQGTSVLGQFSGDYDARAGLRDKDVSEEEEQQGKRYFGKP